MKKIFGFIKRFKNDLISSMDREDCSLFLMKGVVVLNKKCGRGGVVTLIFVLLLTIYAIANNIDISNPYVFLKYETWENFHIDIPAIMFGSHNLTFYLILSFVLWFFCEMIFPHVFYEVYLIDENALHDICKKYYVKRVNGKIITLRYKERVFFKFIENNFGDFDDDIEGIFMK